MLSLSKIRELRWIDHPKSGGSSAFLSAASGLVLREGRALVVADDSRSLGSFPFDPGTPGRRIEVFSGELPADAAARKRVKPDWEALGEWSDPTGSSLLVVPSGSKPNRARGARVGPSSIRALDFAELYAELGSSVAGLNIEGFLATAESVFLFHRGNSRGAVSATIRIDRAAFAEDLDSGAISARGIRAISTIPLGEVAGVRFGFTDAALDPSGRPWFLAAAEATDDAYLDGAFAGAIVGRLDDRCERVLETYPLETGDKPEGLAFDPSEPGRFYLVTDADDPNTPAGLYSGFLPRERNSPREG